MSDVKCKYCSTIMAPDELYAHEARHVGPETALQKTPEKTEDILAQLSLAQTKLEAKDKEIAELKTQIDGFCRAMEGTNPKGATIADFMNVWVRQHEDRAAKAEAEVERQAVLLKKAESALEPLANRSQAGVPEDARVTMFMKDCNEARAVLSELQLKGK